MKLSPAEHDWMRHPGATAIFDALPDGTARFVGGCVRNALLGEPVGDVDIATQLEPEAIIDALKAADIKYVPTGIDHGTITAIIDSTPFEVTSLRKDVETDGRRAVVAFTQDWAEDAQRRDLTINALYADWSGQVYDPCGEGLADIAARKFRFVGDAAQRIQEDYLRILRFFRFLAWYGTDAKVDAEALTACREHRRGLKTLSAERIWSELKKLLCAATPVRAVRIMLTNEILETLLPEASNVEGLELMHDLERSIGLAIDPLLRLMSMGARDEMAMAGLARRLKLSKAEKSRFLAWASDRTAIDADMDEADLKRAVYTMGAQTAFDRFVIRAAGDPGKAASWFTQAEFAKNWERPEFPISGRDLKEAGVQSGPKMGQTLKALEALWIRSGFKTGKPQLLMALQILKK